MFFAFPEDARWNPEREAVEFSVILGQYEGTVQIAAGSFSISSISRRHPRDASKCSTSSGPGSSLWSSRSCAAAGS
jgi:hypothetical protein